MTRKVSRRASMVAILTSLALMLTSASAFAAGGPPPGSGGGSGGGGGGGGETTVTNNLSVPAVFIGSAGFGLTDPALQPPQGDPSTGYEVPGYYYVQGQNKWQAQYVVKASDTVTAKWGDNITGSAMKRVGHQIRVEMGLSSDTEATLQGYSVIKLNPTQADNVSPWGTLAPATAQTMPAKVWMAGAELSIISPSGSVTTVGMPGEINASGAVTFGYNWKPTAAGTYTLEFHAPENTVTFSNPAGATIQVNITTSGGGGVRGGRG